MSGSAFTRGYRRQGLYYPYFHVRNERWLKVAALYWPKIVRIVPADYQTRDSDTVRALATGEFIVRRPPGSSVQAIAPRFADLVTSHVDELRSKFRITAGPSASSPGQWGSPSQVARSLPADPLVNQLWEPSSRAWLTGVHASEMTAELRDALVDAQLAVQGGRGRNLAATINSVDGGPLREFRQWIDPPATEWDEWILMHPQLVSVYTSVLAEDFASANSLQPTTDQDNAYAVTNNWTADRIAAALLDIPGKPSTLSPDELPEMLGFMALNLVVPRDLDRVSITQIIDIRERYGAEFFAFGQAVDEAVASLADLSSIRDEAILKDYLHQAVTIRFGYPLEELRRAMKQLTGDAATMSINVKTQLPAAVAVAGGAWLTGQPLLAGTGALALGLIAIRRSARQQREAIFKSAPAASFLLHTADTLQPKKLLRRTLDRIKRIAGMTAG
jgi:hypothetical protein